MPLLRRSKLFGSQRRTQVLVLLALLEESYPAELVRLLDAQLRSILYIVDDLEADGVVASQRLGRTRKLVLDPRYYAAAELRALLLKLADADPTLRKVAASKRARPRRRGKEL